MRTPARRVSIAAPATRVPSMSGVVPEPPCRLREAGTADAVIVGSSVETREVVADRACGRPSGGLPLRTSSPAIAALGSRLEAGHGDRVRGNDHKPSMFQTGS